MKTHALTAVLVLTLVCLIPINAFAWCTFCFKGSGDCYTFDVPCSYWASYGGNGTCFTLGPLMFNPRTDYVLAENNRAWLVQGQKKTPFASDNMTAFMTLMNSKYPKTKSDDPKTKKEIEAAWVAFLKKPDNGTVSAKRLSEFTREMRLSVRQGEKRSGE